MDQKSHNVTSVNINQKNVFMGGKNHSAKTVEMITRLNFVPMAEKNMDVNNVVHLEKPALMVDKNMDVNNVVQAFVNMDAKNPNVKNAREQVFVSIIK